MDDGDEFRRSQSLDLRVTDSDKGDLLPPAAQDPVQFRLGHGILEAAEDRGLEAQRRFEVVEAAEVDDDVGAMQRRKGAELEEQFPIGRSGRPGPGR